MRTYLLSYKPTPALILRAKQRAKECMSRTADPQECRPHFALVDELQRAVTEDRLAVISVAEAEAGAMTEAEAWTENKSLTD